MERCRTVAALHAARTARKRRSPYSSCRDRHCPKCQVRDIRPNQPRGIHRTALGWEDAKHTVEGKDRLVINPIAGGAIKLTADE